MPRKKKIKSIFLIDFLNVAYLLKENGKPRIKNVELVVGKLKLLSPLTKVICIADPSTPYIIDNKKKYKKLIDEGQIVQVGSGEEADYYMIKYAENKSNCCIITNDGFKNHKFNENLKNRIIRVSIINSEVIFSKNFNEFLTNQANQEEKLKIQLKI